jgi:hypothetical protein
MRLGIKIVPVYFVHADERAGPSNIGAEAAMKGRQIPIIILPKGGF